jgi:hypothetical protein
MRADCVDPDNGPCGCTDACVERAAGDWLREWEARGCPQDALTRLRKKLIPDPPTQAEATKRYSAEQRRPV